MLDTLKHAPLIIGVLDLLHLDDLRLLQHLHGVEPVIVSRLHQMHPAETARAQRPLQDKVIQRVLALGLPHLRLLLVPQLLLGLCELLLRLLLLLLLCLRSGDGVVHGACTGTSTEIQLCIVSLRRLLRRWVGVVNGSSGSGSDGGRLVRGVLRGRRTHMVLRGDCATAFIRGGVSFIVAVLVSLILLLGMVILRRGNGRRRRMVLARAGRVRFSLSQQSPEVRHGESSETGRAGVSDFPKKV